MKIVSKSEQLKIEQTLQALESAAQLKTQQLEKLQFEYENLQDSSSKSTAQLQVEKQALQSKLAELTQQQKQDAAKAAVELKNLQELSSKSTEQLKAEKQALQADKQALQAEKLALASEKQTLQSKLAELTQQQQQGAAKAAAELKNLQESSSKSTAQLQAEKQALQAEKLALASEKQTLQTQLAELTQKQKQDAAKAAAELKNLQESSNKSLKQVQDEKQALQADLTKQQQTAVKAAADLKSLQESSSKSLKQVQDEKQALQADKQTMQSKLAELTKQQQQTAAKADDAAQENELLLLQLMQAQEELVEYYEQKNDFEERYLAYQARWNRLEQRLPGYIDFGVIEIAGFDHLSDSPSVTWRVKDFAQGDQVVPEFLFCTSLLDGQPAVGLKASAEATAPCFAPQLLAQNPEHLKLYRSYSTLDFKKIQAAATILEQIESIAWQGLALPPNFDPSFWRPSLRNLVAQIKVLPPVFRCSQVRLKRELINPDYEHLWLELSDVSLGARGLKKFEVRLGASLVQADGFSQHPKFEFPLIDGKHKPFKSWFAESSDEHGSKLELRFALETQRFDLAVFSKLDEADKLFVLRLMQSMPGLLGQLQAHQVAIHRPWAAWVGLSQAAVNVIDGLIATSAKNKTATAVKQADQVPDQLPKQSQDQEPPAPALKKFPVQGKVIQIGHKAPAAKTAKVAKTTKTTPAKASSQ